MTTKLARILWTTFLGGAIAACGGRGVAATPIAPGAPVVTAAPVDELTPDPGAGGEIETYGVGEVVALESDGEPWGQITVTKVSVHKDYGTYSKPQTKGNVFIQAYVTYKATSDGVAYNPFDWQVFVADEAGTIGFAMDGPSPTLGSGTLSKGRTAKGWLLYEVASKGKVVLSYGGAFSGEVVFEVVIRDK